jgi:hypothetical protein
MGIFGLKRDEETRETYIMRNFIIFTLHQTLER